MYSKDKKNRKNLLVIAAVTVLLVAVLFAFRQLADQDNTLGSADESTAQTGIINFDPPTENEQAAGDQRKEEIINSSSSDLPNEAIIVITDASQYNDEIEVRAFVSNIVSDGECTITFQKENTILERKVSASADASTSPCLTLVMNRTEFDSAGIWEVTIDYTNGAVQGSASKKIEIK